MGNALALTAENFDDEVLRSAIPVLVDFTATWCVPCQRLAPAIEDLAVKYAGKVKVAKFDIDQDPDIPARYNVQGVPTVIIFKGGELVDSLTGVSPKRVYEERIDAALGV